MHSRDKFMSKSRLFIESQNFPLNNLVRFCWLVITVGLVIIAEFAIQGHHSCIIFLKVILDHQKVYAHCINYTALGSSV